MQNGMFMAHSGWRYLVLLAAIVTIAYALYGHVRGRPYGKAMRVLGSVFAGVMHVQILLGIALIFAGRFTPPAGLHAVVMIFAAVCAQIPVSVMRRRPEQERSYGPYAAFGAASLALVVFGILSFGRPLVGG